VEKLQQIGAVKLAGVRELGILSPSGTLVPPASASTVIYDKSTAIHDEMNELLEPLPFGREVAVVAVLEREPEPQARAIPRCEFVDHSFLRELEQSGYV